MNKNDTDIKWFRRIAFGVAVFTIVVAVWRYEEAAIAGAAAAFALLGNILGVF